MYIFMIILDIESKCKKKDIIEINIFSLVCIYMYIYMIWVVLKKKGGRIIYLYIKGLIM